MSAAKLNPTQRRRWSKFKGFELSVGAHGALEKGACAMELAAHIAGEDWSDKPQCVDVALASACRRANDDGPQWVRDAIRDRIPQLIGTADGPRTARARAEIFAWAAIREIAPLALDAAAARHPVKWAHLADHAKKLREFVGTFTEARAVARAAAYDAYADAAAAYAAYAAAAAADAAAYAADAADAAAAAADAYAAYADAAAAYADAAASINAKPIWDAFLRALDRAIGWLP